MEDRELSDVQMQAVDVKVLGGAKVIKDQNESGMEDQSQTEQEPSKVPEEMICDQAKVQSAATQNGN